ncbi:hypothetical protein B0H66DRAFT_113901 [Apodospora peruviana]|uniref:DUF1279 domain-containing protein n=1 Tax=Apodospora peruviana TaxID=516989 RepID=A0AAE0MAA9_9PEZI|nr:hypothetical protein B0H66DRAFT_113901 [Apodospora peruviana]
MFRSAVVDVLFGGGGRSAFLRKVAKDTAATGKLCSRTITTTNTTAARSSSAQFWAQRLANSRQQVLQAGRFRSSQFRAAPRRYFQTSKARRSQQQSGSKPAAEPESLSVSGRLKKLSREYGWAAVGVYLALSALDLPFCFLLVRIVGTDKIAEVEHIVVSNVKKIIPESIKNWWHEYRHALKENAKQQMGSDSEVVQDVEMAGWGVKEAEERTQQEGASLATQFAFAYAIHKSFIFVRVPLTAALLPKVVKVLRSWGYNIGKRRPKP